MLQMRVTKGYLSDRLEEEFNKTYNSRLVIGQFDGLIPFDLQLDDTHIIYQPEDSSRTDTLISVQQLNVEIDVWSLLQNKISVTGFSVDRPSVRMLSDGEEGYSLRKALTARSAEENREDRKRASSSWLNRIEVIAPNLAINNGRLFIEKFHSDDSTLTLPEPLRVSNINSEMFLEISETQRFWDFENFTADVEGIEAGDLQVTGQLYNDDRFLEFNAFNVRAGSSELRLNGQVDGVNLYEGRVSDQLRDAHYNIDVNSGGLRLNSFSDIIPDLPDISEPVDFALQTEGVLDSLWVDELSVGMGNSRFSINGLFKNLVNPDRLLYELKIAEVVLRKRDLEVLTGPLEERQFAVLENLSFNGSADGSADSVNVDLDLESDYGSLSMKGGSQLKHPYSYSGSLSGNRVNLGPLVVSGPDSTALNFDASANGIGINIEDAVLEFNASFYDSYIDGIDVERLEWEVSLLSGFLEHEYTYASGDETITGTGWMELGAEDPSFALKGNAANINLQQYPTGLGLPSSSLNFDYNVELKGLTADRIQGRANIDIKQSVIAGDTVRSHQLYMDLDAPGSQSRTFRLTSSLFDLNMTGDLIPSNIISHADVWASYFRSRIQEEILLNGAADTTAFAGELSPLVMKGTFRAKDLSLIRRYWSDFPQLTTDMRLNFDVNADNNRLLLSTDLRSDTLQTGDLKLNGAATQLTASFRRDRTLKEFSNVDFESTIASFESGLINMDSLSLDVAYNEDSLRVVQNVKGLGENAAMRLTAESVLSDSTIRIALGDFYVGNDIYSWRNEGVPTLLYGRNDRLAFQDFSFKNNTEFFELRGALSPSREDSLLYILRDVNLNRISELIGGRVSFSGRVNGTLVTRSLTERPSIQGDLRVNRFMLQDRLIGDARFNSTYNPEYDRFDTRIAIVTDSTKYADYLDTNDDIGQNIVIDGYFETPDPDDPQDILYDFDVNLKEIDMWVVPLIVHRIFTTMEGEASGQGYFRGNLEDFDFRADFQVENVFAKPRFLNTNYFLNGHVVLDRQDGVIIDSVDVTDTKGGTGLLAGTVDLNDFKPISFLDINFELNDLQFLNNNYDPEVPFYGNLSGTGEVRLTGANTDLFLRTIEPIVISDVSRFSLPLVEETELNENNKFIQFVDDFDLKRRDRLNLGSQGTSQGEIDEERLEEAIQNLTFNERFDLDLQFNAPNNVNVELIFDPVTGEILTARGTGQLRVSMQDEDLQMFGRYNITEGNYKFVSGEIISRRLDLEQGGSIVWEGDPDNARLNINAVYHARPNISSLTTSVQSDSDDITRVPIDLIIEIRGTVSSVENNYYFRLPNTIDLSSNSTLNFTLSQINRDEQQKFLQATSILLTGNFIPTQNINDATTSLSQNLSRSSTVINPILSNQVISPLLSNQINSLLNSDVSQFDIDFNLNAYNQIDLGIALRLYNDRLILRREGQITGAEESGIGDRIGDLNATYRINKGLSVTAFHRQDETLESTTPGSGTGEVTPSVNGVGLEAKVQFNTWQELKRRISNIFRSIFGIKNKENDNKDEKDDLASDDTNSNTEKNQEEKN